MSDTPAKPLMADEIAALVRNGYFNTPLGRQTIATIEQQQEQIEKMRRLEKENVRILGFLTNELQGRIEGGKLGALVGCLERSQEALAATEPSP